MSGVMERKLMHKVILVILDGLNARTAFENMGFLQHMVEMGVSSRYTVEAQLPTLSRPLYEVLLTGVPVYEHGTANNEIRRMSKEQSIFHLSAENGLVTAAAAYGWISELYNKSPFLPKEDRFQLNVPRPIQHGIFYYEDMYPDSHLFNDAEFLRMSFNPDFLLIHSMNIDYAGHVNGGLSPEYVYSVIKADGILSCYIKQWLSLGWSVIVTADHGMNSIKLHNGVSDDERLTPLYIAGAQGVWPEEQRVSQLELAPFICRLLGVAPSKKMKGGGLQPSEGR